MSYVAYRKKITRVKHPSFETVLIAPVGYDQNSDDIGFEDIVLFPIKLCELQADSALHLLKKQRTQIFVRDSDYSHFLDAGVDLRRLHVFKSFEYYDKSAIRIEFIPPKKQCLKAVLGLKPKSDSHIFNVSLKNNMGDKMYVLSDYNIDPYIYSDIVKNKPTVIASLWDQRHRYNWVELQKSLNVPVHIVEMGSTFVVEDEVCQNLKLQKSS